MTTIGRRHRWMRSLVAAALVLTAAACVGGPGEQTVGGGTATAGASTLPRNTTATDTEPPATTEAPITTTSVATPTLPIPDDDPTAARRLADAIVHTNSVDAAIEILGRAGVAVFHDDARSLLQPVAEPASPWRLMHYQVESLVGQRTAAADLDGLVTAPGDIPMSYLIAGYIARGDTFGSHVSRRLMADQNLRQPGTLVFPGLTLALFVADLSPAAERLGTPAGNLRPLGLRTARGGAAAGFCADLKSFLQQTVTWLADAATAIGNEIPVLGPILSFAKEALFLPAELIAKLADSQPFIANLKKAIAVVGILVVAVTAMQPWQVTVTADDPFPHHSVSGEPAVTGRFTAAVATSTDPFDVIRPCAELAGIDLPQAETAVGAPVTWTPIEGFGDHLTDTGHDAAVGAASAARLHYQLQAESASIHAHGLEETAVAQVRATVKRGRVDTISKLADAVFGTGLLGGVIGKLLGPTLIADADAALTKILALADAQGVGAVLVSFHVAQPAHFTWQYLHPAYSKTTITGESRNGLEGPWNVTVVSVLNGGGLAGKGSGTGTFTLPGGEQPGQLKISHPVTITAPLTGQGAHRYNLTVTPIGDENIDLQLVGTATAVTPAGAFPMPFNASAPVTFGGECANPP